MKRIACFLGALLTLVPFCSFSASADTQSFSEAFFQSNGTLPPPVNAPYLTYIDKMADGTAIGGQLNFYYDVPEDITRVFDDFHSRGESDFYTQYQIELNEGCHIQMDMKIDDGAWLSEQGDWDNLDYGDIDTETECFKVDDVFWLDDCSRMHSLMQSYLAYYETETDKYPFEESCLYKDTAGFYQYDLENHTFTFRYRYYLPCSYMDFDGVGVSEQKEAFFSDWSAESSIGKNENLPMLEKPDSVETPTLSEFNVLIDETGYCNAEYYMYIPQSVYDGQKYYLAIENVYDPYLIETQIRVDDGEWTDAYGENPAWLNGGYRSTVYAADSPISPEGNVEFRARIVCNAEDGMASEWSNVVSYVRGIEEDAQLVSNEDAVTEDATLYANDTDLGAEPEHPSCRLCGICPIQPLGICLFVWIGIAAVIVIAVILLCIRSAKKKKAKKSAKKSKNK